MIHADLEEIKERFYKTGKDSKVLAMNDLAILKVLDQWQKIEVLTAYAKGIEDTKETN